MKYSHIHLFTLLRYDCYVLMTHCRKLLFGCLFTVKRAPFLCGLVQGAISELLMQRSSMDCDFIISASRQLSTKWQAATSDYSKLFEALDYIECCHGHYTIRYDTVYLCALKSLI